MTSENEGKSRVITRPNNQFKKVSSFHSKVKGQNDVKNKNKQNVKHNFRWQENIQSPRFVGSIKTQPTEATYMYSYSLLANIMYLPS